MTFILGFIVFFRLRLFLMLMIATNIHQATYPSIEISHSLAKVTKEDLLIDKAIRYFCPNSW